MKQDWRKTDRKFYLPGTEPELIKIPSFRFFTIEGKGDPNDKFFADYIGVLYSLSYAVKMSPKNGSAPKDYFDYTVYPLEGLWDISEEAKLKMAEKLDKKSLIFNLMIRQPEFVTEAFALETIERTKKKKHHPLLEKIKFCTLEDSDCIQMMHLGSYDNEPASFKKMEDFCGEINVFRESKRHREIYLSDARKVSPDKLKTVLRFKIIKTDKA
jgi:hypothetical protein